MLIIDANVISKFVSSEENDYTQVLKCINSGKILISFGGSKQLQEYSFIRSFIALLIEWKRAGRARQFDTRAIDNLTSDLVLNRSCISNDHHIIALLIISKAKLVCTEDVDLHTDIKNQRIVPLPKRKIYQNKKQWKLLNYATSD
jgi:hypothetical protein